MSSQAKTEQTEISKYTQRQWDRVVGYGAVPEDYKFIKTCPECKMELSEYDWCSHCRVRR